MSRAKLMPGTASGGGLVTSPGVHGDEEQESVSMNVVLWVVQAALALLYLSGGAYKLTSSDELGYQLLEMPSIGWQLLGVIELCGAVLLVVPGVLKRKAFQTPLAAALLAAETLALAAFYAMHSLELAATNPMVWALVMGLMAAGVAYGRYRRNPAA